VAAMVLEFLSEDHPNIFDKYEIDWNDPQESKDDVMNFPSHICISYIIRENTQNATPFHDIADATSRPVTIET